MAHIEYNKVRDGQEKGRRKEEKRDTMWEAGVRVGKFEAGIRTTGHKEKLDEQRKDVKEKVRRTLEFGFGPPKAAAAPA